MIRYDSPLVEEFLTTGRCESCPIIDMHAHMFDNAGCNMLVDTTARQVAQMDKNNVPLAFMISHDALYGGYSYFEADHQAAEEFPGRFYQYVGVVDPGSDPKRDIEFLESHKYAVGFKFHGDTYHVSIADESYDPYYAYADERKLPILFHTWGGSRYDGEGEAPKVLAKWHNFPFIAGHSFQRIEESIALCKAYPNLYLELTAVLSKRGMVDAYVKAGLSDRILFGVDAPWFSYEFGIGALLSADISDEDIRNILYRNPLRIMKEANIEIPESLKKFANE